MKLLKIITLCFFSFPVHAMDRLILFKEYEYQRQREAKERMAADNERQLAVANLKQRRRQSCGACQEEEFVLADKPVPTKAEVIASVREKMVGLDKQDKQLCKTICSLKKLPHELQNHVFLNVQEFQNLKKIKVKDGDGKAFLVFYQGQTPKALYQGGDYSLSIVDLQTGEFQKMADTPLHTQCKTLKLVPKIIFKVLSGCGLRIVTDDLAVWDFERGIPCIEPDGQPSMYGNPFNPPKRCSLVDDFMDQDSGKYMTIAAIGDRLCAYSPTQGCSMGGHRNPISAAKIFKSDGFKAVTAAEDGALCVWDLENFQIALDRQGNQIAWMGHSKRVYAVAVTYDGGKWKAISGARAIRVWDLSTGQPILNQKGEPIVIDLGDGDAWPFNLKIIKRNQRAVIVAGIGYNAFWKGAEIRMWYLDSGEPVLDNLEKPLVIKQDDSVMQCLTPYEDEGLKWVWVGKDSIRIHSHGPGIFEKEFHKEPEKAAHCSIQ